MKYGITAGAGVDFENPKEGMEKLSKLGYKYLDGQYFVTKDYGYLKYSTSEGDVKLKALAAAAKEYDIEFSQCHGPWECPPHHTTDDERAKLLEDTKKSLYGCAVLGAPAIALHPVMPFGVETVDRFDEFNEINLNFFSKVAEMAKQEGVTACLENMPMPKLALGTPQQILNFVKIINNDNFKVCLDTGHSLVCGIQPGEAVKIIGKDYLMITHIHDNDGKMDYHYNPGDERGVADWNLFNKALHEINFEGVLSLETAPQPGDEEKLANVIRKIAE